MDGVSLIEARQRVLKLVQNLQQQEEGDEGRPLEPAIVESQTIEKPWGWIFFWNTQLFLDTGDLEHAIVGPPPVCVNRHDGSLAQLEPVEPLSREIRRYERRIGVRPWWRFW